MTKHQAENLNRLTAAGFSWHHANQLRLIAMTLHRWAERECGDGNGCISRDETTGKPVWESSWGGKPVPIRDMEAGALRRLKTILLHYPGWAAFHQGDPRGASLYVYKPADIPAGASVDSCYSSRGIAIF
jgi:hypothetical protein